MQGTRCTLSPQVSVVIVNWNTGDVLTQCIRSLVSHPPKVPWEVIVVDNASTDNSLVTATVELPELKLIRNGTNRGLAAANNQGLIAASAPFIVISNPDVLFSEGALDALLDTMGRRQRAAFVVAKLLHPTGEIQTAAGNLPTLAEALLGRRASWRRDRHNSTSGIWWHGWAHDTERMIGHGGEACYMVRREAVADVGLQDEHFILDWEGLDWSARVWDAGWEVWFCPNATVTHLGGESVRKARYRWIISSHLGMYHYFSARVPPIARPGLAAVIAARGAAKLLAAAAGLSFYERSQAGV